MNMVIECKCMPLSRHSSNNFKFWFKYYWARIQVMISIIKIIIIIMLLALLPTVYAQVIPDPSHDSNSNLNKNIPDTSENKYTTTAVATELQEMEESEGKNPLPETKMQPGFEGIFAIICIISIACLCAPGPGYRHR
jgi:hypothetical protein